MPADLSPGPPLAETLDKLYSQPTGQFDEILRLARTAGKCKLSNSRKASTPKVAVPKLLTRVRGCVQDMVDAGRRLPNFGIVPLKIEPPPARPLVCGVPACSIP